jgi:hypothetical protein
LVGVRVGVFVIVFVGVLVGVAVFGFVDTPTKLITLETGME